VQLKWTDLADIDLAKIEVYIARENSLIDSVHLILPDHPRAGRLGRLRNTRELVIEGIPFVVIYREHISTNCIEILRVLHDAQQWPTTN